MKKDKIQTIADHYSISSQLRQLAEECTGLSLECLKSIKNHDVTVNLISEIADVEIMIEQIKYHIRISEDDIQKIKEAKIERQLERIKEEV